VKLVVDASVAIAAAATPVGFARFTGIDLVAPPLLWIEVVSSLHAAMWRGELRRDQAEPQYAAPSPRRSTGSHRAASKRKPGRSLTTSAGRRPTTPTTSLSRAFSTAAL